MLVFACWPDVIIVFENVYACVWSCFIPVFEDVHICIWRCLCLGLFVIENKKVML